MPNAENPNPSALKASGQILDVQANSLRPNAISNLHYFIARLPFVQLPLLLLSFGRRLFFRHGLSLRCCLSFGHGLSFRRSGNRSFSTAVAIDFINDG